VLDHGIATGVIVRWPTGSYGELRQPLRTDEQGRPIPTDYHGAPVRKQLDPATLAASIPPGDGTEQD